MTSIIRPHRGLAKPPSGTPLNPAHPLARGLRLMYAFNEGGGRSVTNLVQPGRNTLAVTADPTWTQMAGQPGVGGLVLKGQSNARAASVPYDASWAPTGSVTYACYFIPIALPTNGYIWGSDNNANGTGLFWSGTVLDQYYGNGAAYYDPGTGAASPPLGKPTLVVGVYDNVAHTVTNYQDGVPFFTSSQTITPSYDTTNGLAFSDYSSSSAGFQSTTAFIGFWIYERALAPGEVRQLGAAPFSMLAPPRRLWVASAVAGGTTWTRSGSATIASTTTPNRLVSSLRQRAAGDGQMMGLGFLPSLPNLLSPSVVRLVGFVRGSGPTIAMATAIIRLSTSLRSTATTVAPVSAVVRLVTYVRDSAITDAYLTAVTRSQGWGRVTGPTVSVVSATSRLVSSVRAAGPSITAAVGTVRQTAAVRTQTVTQTVATTAKRTVASIRSQSLTEIVTVAASGIKNAGGQAWAGGATIVAGISAASVRTVVSLRSVAVTQAAQVSVARLSSTIRTSSLTLTQAVSATRSQGWVRLAAITSPLSPAATLLRSWVRTTGPIVALVPLSSRTLTLLRFVALTLQTPPASTASSTAAALLSAIRRHFVVPPRLFHFLVPPRSVHFIVSDTPYALPATPGTSDNTIGSTENNISYDIDFGPWLHAGEGLVGCGVTCTAVLRSNPTFDMTANAAAFVINSAISGTKVVGTVDPHNALIGARYTLLFSATTSLGFTYTKPLQPLDCDR